MTTAPCSRDTGTSDAQHTCTTRTCAITCHLPGANSTTRAESTRRRRTYSKTLLHRLHADMDSSAVSRGTGCRVTEQLQLKFSAATRGTQPVLASDHFNPCSEDHRVLRVAWTSAATVTSAHIGAFWMGIFTQCCCHRFVQFSMFATAGKFMPSIVADAARGVISRMGSTLDEATAQKCIIYRPHSIKTLTLTEQGPWCQRSAINQSATSTPGSVIRQPWHPGAAFATLSWPM